MQKYLVLFAGLMLALIFTSCIREDTNLPKVSIEEVEKVASMNRQFGLDLLREFINKDNKDNVLISPWSIQTALNMALNGADGKTLEEMLAVLYCENCDTESLNEQQALLRLWMESQSGHPTLTSANGYFFDKTRIDIENSFREKLESHYKAAFKDYNFADPATVDKINDWVKNSTKGKIDEIVKDISNDDLALLINALHFKADWATAFDKNLTHKAPFVRSDRTVKEVDYVAADRDFHHLTTEQVRMVDIPFRDSTYSLSLIKFNGESVSISSFDDTYVQSLYDKLSYDRAWVAFPKLNLSFDESLIDPLQTLGMKEAFVPHVADFSRMGRSLIGPDIYISQIRHKATLEVDEKGAEGAAVTSITFTTTSLPPSYVFDTSFVLILRHIPTQTFLFLAWVDDPQKG